MRKNVVSGKCRSNPANNMGKNGGHRCRDVIDNARKVVQNFLDHSKVSFEKEIFALISELDSAISSSGGTIKDNGIFKEGLIVLFELVTILEDDEVPVPTENVESCFSNLDASTIVMWDSIALLLFKLFDDENSKRQNTKRNSFMKLENDEADAMLRAIERPMFEMVGIEGQNDTILYSLINHEARYKQFISMLKCLRIFLKGFGVYLCNELRLRKVVEHLVIPLLAFDLNMLPGGKDAKSISVQKILAIHIEVLQCTIQVLRLRRNSSTLLSSQHLYFDTRRIKENSLSQSIGETILHVLVKIMNVDAYLKQEENSWIYYSCECLMTFLKTMDSNTKKTGKTVVSISVQMQVASIFKWVHKSLQCHLLELPLFKTRSSIYSILELLGTLVQLYPKSCAQFWALFLPPPTSIRQTRSEHDGTEAPRNCNLIHIMSMPDDSTTSLFDIRVKATHCCKDILQALPFNLWSRSGYLAGRIESSLDAIIETTSAILSKQISVNEMGAVYSLAVTIITVVPYEKYSILMDSAVGLVKQIAQNYSKYGLHGGLGLEVVVGALIESLGGKEMPNGDITPLPLPMQKFLMGSMSSSFFNQLFFKISEISSKTVIERGIQTMIQMQLFVKVVKSAPWIFNENSKRLDSMIDLLKLLLSSDDKMLIITGSELLSAFIVGQKQGGFRAVCSEEELPISLYECLYAALTQKDTMIRCSILSTYSLMSFNVWRILLMRTSHNPLNIILSFAMEYSGDPNSTVRSDACKALGNISTVLIKGYSALESNDLSLDVLDNIIKETAMVTVNATEDSNSSVRSMALFAIGNIIYDSVQSNKWRHARLLPMQKLCRVVYESLFDENDKVVSNAIRTSGHFYTLLNLQILKSDEIPTGMDTYLELSDRFLKKLGDIINQAVEDAIQVSETKSWKQRMNTKKQAWGACQAYSSILQYSSLSRNLPNEIFEMAILNLIRCVECAHDVNEKIIASALSCLTLIDVETWKSISFESGIRGRCLSACLSKKALKSFIPSIERDVHLIMSSLTFSLNDQDIQSLLTGHENIQENLENLYLWMVDNASPSQMFESFGDALLTTSMNLDFSLAQRFKSRAVCTKRRLRSMEDLRPSESDASSDDDEL